MEGRRGTCLSAPDAEIDARLTCRRQVPRPILPLSGSLVENFPLGEAMDDTENADHYEALQVSPRADHETIQRVFRHLAKRFHPDNADSGDPERFKLVMEAFRVLSHPKTRAKYDTAYEQVRETRWRIFDQETSANDVAADRRIRVAALSLLYTARRNDPD